MRIPLNRAQRDLFALVDAVERDGERIVLTRRGHVVAALVPPGALPALDLLGRMLPAVADVARDLRPIDPLALGLEPAPDPEAERALRSRLSDPGQTPPPQETL